MSLNTLPLETSQSIASYLDDQSLVSFRATCQGTRAAIDARPAHFWMYRFREHYDLPRKIRDLDELREKYQSRRQHLRSITLFKDGNTTAEVTCLTHIIHLILDTNPETTDEYGVPESKNLDVLDHVARTSNILQCIFARTQIADTNTPMHKASNAKVPREFPRATGLQIVQLLLSSRSLSFITPNPIVLSFPESQQMAYMDVIRQPLFGGPTGIEVNLVWALHVVNFFRYHMLRDNQFTLCPAFRDLSTAMSGMHMPQMWKKKLSNDDSPTPIGRNWKGSYAYLSRRDISKIRKATDVGAELFEDHNVDLGHKAIQEMEIDFPAGPGPIDNRVWPDLFERHLDGEQFLYKKHTAWPEPPVQVKKTTRSNKKKQAKTDFVGPECLEGLKSRYFTSVGWDDENFNGSGWITQLPTQLKIFPGFKRLVMMKYFIDENGYMDLGALWAYEGVVLPGDQVIVGRWWSPETDQPLSKMYSGPFILWNTDCGAKYEEIHKPTEDQDILDAMHLTHG